MKNKIKLIVIIFFLLASHIKIVLSEEFEFEATEIQILSNGNLIKAINGVKIISDNNIQIIADEFTYDKSESLLTAKGKVNFLDAQNSINIKADKIIYLKRDEKIIANGNVNFSDSVNKINLKTEKVFYSKKEKKIYSKIITETVFEDNFYITSQSFSYYIDKKEFFSDEKTDLKDNFGNLFSLNKLKFNMKKKLVRGDKVKYYDNQSNKYYLENAMIDLNTNEIVGKDIKINFNPSIFGNPLNEPRLKANKLYSNKNSTVTSKGVFTTCKKRDGCPPWTLSAKEIKHDKIKKTMNYKNAWLKIYDQPVIYFPKFIHPDPTVKRQSGFLTPSIFDSNNLGLAMDIPYYKVISDNKDLTFKPRFYSNENIILQSEYRQVNKNNNHIVDLSLHKDGGLHNNKKNSSKTHFFSKSILNLDLKNFDSSNIELNIKTVSNDTYLKTYKINSKLVNSNYSTLNSYFKLNAERDDLSFNTSFEIYEDLSKPLTDRYEFIYPNFDIKKTINMNDNFNSNLSIQSTGYQKKYNTNVYEAVVINDLLVSSDEIVTENGFKNNFKYLFKNVNTNGNNSSTYKDDTEHELLSLISFETTYPLRKLGNNSESFITPILSARISPNKTKDLRKDDRRIDINNIYSLNRIGNSNTIEGGESLTLGAEYKRINKNNNELVSLNLAQVFRVKENNKLATNSTIGKKSSDLVGRLRVEPNKYFNFDYNFSLDNNLDRSNYDLIKTELNVNNFVTSFEFLEEKNAIGSESFIKNSTSYKVNNSNSLSFETRRNKKTDATEFYNLIYEYKNDCLVASIKYNKDYYTDTDLKPEEQIFFSITIVPFGKLNSVNLNQ